MGVGKSTVGAELARRLGLPFVDADREVEARAGISIAEVFAERGEAWFRLLERAVVAELLAGGARVVALGGGAVVDPATRRSVLERALVVHLHVPWQELWPRLQRLATERPLLVGRTEAEVQALYRRREPAYREAHLTVTVPSGSPGAAARRIEARLRAYLAADRRSTLELPTEGTGELGTAGCSPIP
jgi:shikimate kinase